MFPESRRKAYYLMSIHEHLPPEAKRELKAVGWTKGMALRFFKFLPREDKEGVSGPLQREGIVNWVRPKRPRLRLNPESYERLRDRVLRWDGWKCQCCGTMSNLEVHHKELRSHSGDDAEQNLITLCTACHATLHSG
jgi:hypothetical protein